MPGKANSPTTARTAHANRSTGGANGYRFSSNEWHGNTSRINMMRGIFTKPAALVLIAWFGIFCIAAWAAFGPVHRNDIPRFWSPRSFVSIVLGPVSVFLEPNPTMGDRIGAVVLALSLTGATLWYLCRPSVWAAWVFIVLTNFWLLLGLAGTFAWV
jgi:hypothetical protein